MELIMLATLASYAGERLPFLGDGPLAPGAEARGQLRLRQIRDDLDQFVAAVAVALGLGQQVPGLGQHSALLRGAGDRDAPAAAEFQQPFIAQQAQRPQHGVAVDPQYRGQVPGRGQPLARLGLALGDGPADLGGGLLVQRDRVARVESLTDRAGGTSHSAVGTSHSSLILAAWCSARHAPRRPTAPAWTRSRTQAPPTRSRTWRPARAGPHRCPARMPPRRRPAP